jgi:hydroxymethylpyrimidine pyrophosphatase-like HAD family hydrolase
LTLVYVSGRNQSLIIDAIDEYDVPIPDYAIGDVGTTLYRITGGNWQMVESWWRHIGKDWQGLTGEELAELLQDLDELKLQEPEKQNRYKLSYYADAKVDHRSLSDNIRQRLRNENVAASVIWSVDEAEQTGLIDILPSHATKLHAIKFLLKIREVPEERAVFAGDSGNDLDALTSGLPAILVKNAAADVIKEALEVLSRKRMADRLYLARGDFLGMNGNYAAGVLEGLVHFFPHTKKWITEAIA